MIRNREQDGLKTKGEEIRSRYANRWTHKGISAERIKGKKIGKGNIQEETLPSSAHG